MNITIRNDKKIEIEMKDQLLEFINILQDKVTGVVSSPDIKYLLLIDEDEEVLN